MVRVGVAAENSVAVIFQLPEACLKMFQGAEFGVVDLDLVAEKVEQEPDEKIRDQHEACDVVRDHGRFERHQI